MLQERSKMEIFSRVLGAMRSCFHQHDSLTLLETLISISLPISLSVSSSKHDPGHAV